jgi:hypothetical protein
MDCDRSCACVSRTSNWDVIADDADEYFGTPVDDRILTP